MTTSLKQNGVFHWGDIRTVLGESTYTKMQRLRNNRIWLVDHADVSPGSRNSVLDYASVANAELYNYLTNQHLTFARPLLSDAQSRQTPGNPTCNMVALETKDYELEHYVDRTTLNSVHDNFMVDILVSFYDAIALQAESAVHNIVAKMNEENFADVVSMKQNSEIMKIAEEDPLDANKIADAASAIIRRNPDVPYPQGLVCMVSPAQAMQLFDESAVRADHLNVYGIDTIVSPAVGFNRDYHKYEAIVTPKKSILVALSLLEIDAVPDGSGTHIRAQYALGVTIDPSKAVKIISWRE